MPRLPSETFEVNLELFEYARIGRGDDLPPVDSRLIDVMVLDMNHGAPNLGHDSLVHSVHESARSVLGEMGLGVRLFSIDVRRSGPLPRLDFERFRLFVGTGGPGHLDPARNDGVDPWSEGIIEDPSWLGSFHELLDGIYADSRTAFVGFCHSFGIVCRWSGIAEAVLRGEEEGGRSEGIVTYELSREALSHPWFSRFAAEIRDFPRFRVLDSRWFNLVPTGTGRHPFIPLAYESGGEALTMVELARDDDGVTPRMFAANHHPEVIDIQHLMEVLGEKLAKGEVDEAWKEKRAASILSSWNEPFTEERVRRTSRYTLTDLLDHHLRRIASERR